MSFLRGFLAPFRGAAFVARERLWGYLLVPLAVNAGIAGLAAWLAWQVISREPRLMWMLQDGSVVGRVIILIALSILGLAAFILLQPVIAAPFLDLLSEKVEERVRGGKPSVGWLKAAVRSVLHGLLKLVFYGVAMAMTVALTALTGVGGLLGFGLGVAFLAYDGFDYPLSRRSFGFAAKWGYLRREPLLSIGYGLGTTVLYMIPLAFLVAPPFAAAGATLAFLEAESANPTQSASAHTEGETR